MVIFHGYVKCTRGYIRYIHSIHDWCSPSLRSLAFSHNCGPNDLSRPATHPFNTNHPERCWEVSCISMLLVLLLSSNEIPKCIRSHLSHTEIRCKNQNIYLDFSRSCLHPIRPGQGINLWRKPIIAILARSGDPWSLPTFAFKTSEGPQTYANLLVEAKVGSDRYVEYS